VRKKISDRFRIEGLRSRYIVFEESLEPVLRCSAKEALLVVQHVLFCLLFGVFQNTVTDVRRNSDETIALVRFAVAITLS
jgi:hypothetical protein